MYVIVRHVHVFRLPRLGCDIILSWQDSAFHAWLKLVLAHAKRCMLEHV